MSQMRKNQLALVVAAIFVAAPIGAKANPTLTHPTGTVLSPVAEDVNVGGVTVFTTRQIKATNVGNAVLASALGSVFCSSVAVTGALTTNNTAAGIKGDVETALFAGSGSTAAGEPATECTSWTGGVSVTPNPSTNGLPWCMEATSGTDEVRLRGNACTTPARAIRLNLAFTSIGSCVYQRSGAAKGVLATDQGFEEATVSYSEQEWAKLEGGFGCPGSMTLSLTLTLETDPAAEPVFFSS